MVCLSQDGFLDYALRTPTFSDGRKSAFDLPGMVDVIRDVASSTDELLVAIEKVGAMPRDGRVGAFSFGRGYGIWLGILATMAIPYTEVTPQRWQSRMLAGLPRGPQTKTSAVQRSKSLFPSLPIKVKADWGMADAALIAEFARQVNQGGG